MFTLRLATRDDLPTLRTLIPLSVRALSHGHYTEAQIESAIHYVFGVDTQLITDETYFVAEAGEEIIGCGGWSRRRTLYGGDQVKAGEDEPLDPGSDPARIRAFFVHPDWVRRGIGLRLMAACLQEARDAGFHRLELMATGPGEALYRASGFVVMERVETVLPNGASIPFTRMTRAINGHGEEKM